MSPMTVLNLLVGTACFSFVFLVCIIGGLTED
jgi:hypothetical protein